MELRLEPELAAKLERWSAETGQPMTDLVEAAVRGYFDEVEAIRATLDSRYDDIVQGRVDPLDGPETVRKIKERAADRRKAIA